MAYKRAFEDMFIKGAVNTVASVGIENTRTKDIASQTGFTEATMYRMFPTKEILLRDAFLYIDKQIADILTQSAFIRHPDKTPTELAAYAIWRRVYRYMIDHWAETIFMIRYRYSSLYTEDVRKMREIYNGGTDRAYTVFVQDLEQIRVTEWQLLLDSAFELTLCFAEKVINGRMPDTDETELGVWSVIMNAMEAGMKKIG